MPFEDVLVHTGRPVTPESVGPKVDGKAQVTDVQGTPFDCCLFMPAPGAEDERQGRKVKRPTLLLATEDRAGVALVVTGKLKVLVTAPELTGPDPVLWQVQGDPQPFGKPGEDLIGSQVTLRRIED